MGEGGRGECTRCLEEKKRTVLSYHRATTSSFRDWGDTLFVMSKMTLRAKNLDFLNQNIGSGLIYKGW